MREFTQDEQLYNDLDWFAVDKNNRIGHFTTVGWRLLPPSIAKNKEDWEKVFKYFESLKPVEDGYKVCSNLQSNLDLKSIPDFNRYIKSFSEMSARGLYSYDSYGSGSSQRPYFRVTIPSNELILDKLPEEIKHIMEVLRLNEISFSETYLIPEKFTDKI